MRKLGQRQRRINLTIEINDQNFAEHFLDIRKHGPKKGQILVCFTAIADFVDGWVKRNVIDLLFKNDTGAESARKVMRNLVCSTEIDSIRIPKQICEDLLKGMTTEEVAAKPYKMQIEHFYWTKPENLPQDPHWSAISILNL